MAGPDKWKPDSWRSSLRELAHAIQTSRNYTRELGWRLESRANWLGRRLLKAALSTSSPIGSTTGLDLLEINDSRVVLQLNSGWPDFLVEGASGASIVNAAEVAAKLFWERQLAIGSTHMLLRELRLKNISTVKGPLVLQYVVQPEEREQWMSTLRRSGEAHPETSVQVFDKDGKLIATCDMNWTFERQLQLESRAK